MKNYRKIVPVVLALILGLSWYMLLSDSISNSSQYEKYLNEARKNADLGITKYAIKNYNEAIELDNNPDIYVEVAEYYKKQEDKNLYIDWCEYFFETFPTDSKAYDYVLDAYLMDSDYSSAYEVLNMASKRNVTSEKIEKCRNEIMYSYYLEFNTYNDVSVFSSNFCAVKQKETWSFVNSKGNRLPTVAFKSVGEFTTSGLAPVVDEKNNVYFIDTEGDKVKVTKDKYISFGNISQDIFMAQKENTQFVYLDLEFNQLFDENDLATTFNDNVAAIKNNKKWKLINIKGKSICDKQYVDVIRDEKEIVSRCERLFVAENEGKYKLINTDGKEVISQVYEDAQLFMGQEPTAVKIEGKWCFIDTDGKRKSEKTYEDARPYSNGLAAVCIDGKWGFVDDKENIVIEPQFFDAKAFNDKGCCFVKTGDNWQLLKLYRFN